jgi:NAD(P)-dependent dehydrogenase (short-subunit alcohol dehydrogenase family)
MENFLVVGATSEIARAVLAELTDRSRVRVLAVSRSHDEELDQLASDRIAYISGIDCTTADSLAMLSRAIDEFFNVPFAVIHSVGSFWAHKPLVDTPWAEVVDMVASHFVTLMGVTRAALPTLIRVGGGRIIALSCNSVAYSYPDMSPFTASKAAVESFVRCVANEYSEHAVAATAIALPTIRTERVVLEKPSGDHANYVTPQEVARIIINDVAELPHIVTGNVLKVFRHSHSFYHQGYFQRNPRSRPLSAAFDDTSGRQARIAGFAAMRDER